MTVCVPCFVLNESAGQKGSRFGCSPKAEGLELSFGNLLSGVWMPEMVAVPVRILGST